MKYLKSIKLLIITIILIQTDFAEILLASFGIADNCGLRKYISETKIKVQKTLLLKKYKAEVKL